MTEMCSPVPEGDSGGQDPFTLSVMGAPGKPGCPKRKRAYYRAAKAGRDLPGLASFRMAQMIDSMAKAWHKAFWETITTPNPFLKISGDYKVEVVDGRLKPGP